MFNKVPRPADFTESKQVANSAFFILYLEKLTMENGNLPKKKSKKKKIRSNSPQASNGTEKVSSATQ
jgi:hypothetical protein